LKILALAARTPVGLTAESTAAAVQARISRVVEHPFLVDALGDPLRCGSDARLDAYLLGPARIAALARAAFDEVVRKLGAALGPASVVILVLPEHRPGQQADEDAELLQIVGAFVRPLRFELGPRGHAGTLAAFVRARELLQQGAPMVVVLAADSYLEPDTLRWLDTDRRLPGEGMRGGFLPGEAGAALAFAPTAQPWSWLASLAMVRSLGVGVERRTRNDVEGSLGEGLTEALRQATAGLQLPDEAADDLYGDINGERLRNEDWAFSVQRLPLIARRATDFRLSVDACGDVGAATGALGCVLAVRAWARAYASGPRALVWAGSDGGLRAVAVLEREVS
jgi:3-oxoacyl-[acyl-carrier-protein] synthase-1